MMIPADIYDFYMTYAGVMEETEIARELRIPLTQLKVVKKEFSQLCWTCRNACSGWRCEWVNTGLYPRYVIVEDGYITKCERYAEDKEG